MATTRKERTEVIEQLQRDFTEAQGIYLTDINRISVEKMTKLRKDLRDNKIRYFVVKNTLAIAKRTSFFMVYVFLILACKSRLFI
jgi:ribosomal protein L10